MNKRVRKLILPLVIILALNEGIPSTAHPIAFVLYEGAVLTIAAAEAIGLAEIFVGAVVLSEAVHEMQIAHAAAQTGCNYIAAESGIHPKEGKAITATGEYYADYVHPEERSKITTVDAPAIIARTPKVQNRIKNHAPTRSAKEHAVTKTIPYPSCSAPIQFKFYDADSKPHTRYFPGGFRTTLGNGYFEMKLKPIPTPKRKGLLEREQDFINRYWIHDRDFQKDIHQAISHCLDVLINSHSSMHSQQVEARLRYINLKLPGMYGQHLLNLINQLLPYYFNSDGSLKDFYNIDEFDILVYNYFIFPLYGEDTALKVLKTKNLRSAIDRIENPEYFSRAVNWIALSPIHIGYKLKESFWDFAPGEWKGKIRENKTNQQLLALIDACRENDWEAAQKYRYCCPIHSEEIYQDYYGKHHFKTYNDFGIYRIVEADPLWQNISHAERKALTQNQQKQKELNDQLLIRLNWKNKIQHAWEIPNNAHWSVHNTLYQLVGISSTPQLIDAIFNAINAENPHRKPIIDAFFNSKGILKDIETYDNAGLGAIASLLSPELHTQCHQFNQLIYAFNTEKNVARKAAIARSLKLFSELIKANNLQSHQVALQSTYIAIATNQQTDSINEQLKLFYHSTELACEISGIATEPKLPDIQTCPEQDDSDIPVLGCGLPEIPTPEVGGCIEDLPEVPENKWLPESKESEVVSSCNWGRSGQIPGLDVSTEEIADGDQTDESLDELGNESSEDTSETITYEFKDKKQTEIKAWKLSGDKKKAIDPEKIDFSELDLTSEEIELLKTCINLFLEIEGFLGHDSPLARILKGADKNNKRIGSISMVNGALFELEEALMLYGQGVIILGLGNIFKGQHGLKEIDIITENEFIECKDVKWERKTAKEIGDIKSSLGAAKKISIQFQKKLIFISKQPIPQNIKEWLDKSEISYIERNIA